LAGAMVSATPRHKWGCLRDMRVPSTKRRLVGGFA
jgi:hypothetical protein